MTDVVDAVLAFVAGLDATLLQLVVGLFMLLETSVGIGLVVPGDAVVLLAASTVTTPWAFTALVAATVAGSLAGETIGWGLGRRYGDRIRASRLGRLVGEQRWAAVETFLHGRGGGALAVARFMAVAHAVAPVVAGTARMPFRRFAGWCLVGSTAWAITYVSVGAAVGASWRAYGHRLGALGYLLLAAATVAVLLVGRHKRRARRSRAAAEAKAEAKEHRELVTTGRR